MKKRAPLVLAAIGFAASGAFAQASKPNIIVIVADDLGYGDIGSFGSASISTPRLDQLSAQGVRFTDFHSNGAVCSPTRAAFLTGCYPIRAGVPGVVEAADRNQPGMDTSLFTLPQILKHAGYATGLFGKWHLGYHPYENPVRRGFDEFRGFLAGNVDYFSHVDQEGYYDWYNGIDSVTDPGYLTRVVTTQAIGFVKRHSNSPFFLYLAHGAPHSPYQGPNDAAFRVVNPGVTQAGVPGQSEAQKAAKYDEMTEFMDAQIGRLIDSLKALGLERNTFVLFFSDNGPAGTTTGTAGLFLGRKGSVLEGGHRVPALAWWPGTIAAERTSAETVAGFDLFPALAAMAGIRVNGLDGIDISRVILNGDTVPDRTLFWASGADIGARRGKWKLDKINDTVSLYNLDAAPQEANNVAGANAAVRNALVAEMNAWQVSVRNKPAVTWSFISTGLHAPGMGGVDDGSNSSAWTGEVTVRFFSPSGRLLRKITRRRGILLDKDIAALPTGICFVKYTSLAGSHLGIRRLLVNVR